MVDAVRARQDPLNDALLAEFGARLRSFRREAGLTQTELADTARLHRTTVGGFERGEVNPTLVAIVSLAGALGCTADQLVVGLELRRDDDPGGEPV